MEPKQLTELLRVPLGVEQLPVEELRELASLYPYSPSLQMLLLKHYQLNEHPAYDEQVGKAAIYAPDRRALYRLVQLRETTGERVAKANDAAPTHTFETIVPEPEMVALEKPQPEETAAANPVEHVIEAVSDPIEPVEQILPTEEGDAIHITDTGQEHIVVEEEHLETAETEPTFRLLPPVIPHVRLDETEPSIPEEQKASESDKTDIASEPTEKVTEPIAAEEKTVVPSTNPEPEMVEEPAMEIPEPIMVHGQETWPKQVEIATKPDTVGTHSFTDWLHRMKRDGGQGTVNTQTVTEEKSELDTLFKAGTYEATLVKASSEMPDSKPTKEELHVADEEANRRMDAQARKSLNRGEQLVTETLAKIYEIQKKYAKAIEAYEILKLRHPEKATQYDRKIQSLRQD